MAPYGRIFRIDPAGEWTLAPEYDGWPNGLKIDATGRIVIADYKNGLMQLDAAAGEVTPLHTHVRSESFKGVNDLVHARNGDIYMTDSDSGQQKASLRVLNGGLDAPPTLPARADQAIK